MNSTSPLQPINQDAVFYTGPWERHIENNILSDISSEKERGLWVHGDDTGNRRCLERVRDDMIVCFSLYLPLEEYVAKVNEWQTRFEKFSKLLETYSLEYDTELNKVAASEQTWRQIQAEKPELMCYYHEGEYNWLYLKHIFTHPPSEVQSDSYGSDVPVESPTAPGSLEYPAIFP